MRSAQLLSLQPPGHWAKHQGHSSAWMCALTQETCHLALWPPQRTPVRRLVSDGDVAAKRTQVQSDKEKAASFRAEHIPLLAGLGQLDPHIDTYDRSVQEGAAAARPPEVGAETGKT